jgi:hypothetical protein
VASPAPIRYIYKPISSDVAEWDLPGDSKEVGPHGNDPSGIELVERPGLGRGTLAMKVAAGAVAIVLTVVAALAPQMAIEWRAALVALGAVMALVMYFESESPSRHKKDHLMFELDAPREKVAASVKAFLERNRISNTASMAHSILGGKKPDPNAFYLGSWSAQLRVGADEDGKNDAVLVIVGPFVPDTETPLRKMMADLKKELERELVSREV